MFKRVKVIFSFSLFQVSVNCVHMFYVFFIWPAIQVNSVQFNPTMQDQPRTFWTCVANEELRTK